MAAAHWLQELAGALAAQLLPHLQTLEWGFRIGGTVINAQLVMQVVTAVGVTAVTTISQAALQQVAP